MRDDLTVVIGILRGLNGRVDGLQEEVRGLRPELGAVHRREDRRGRSIEDVTTRLDTLEARIERLERERP
jgi:predicted nuclease with TOPRIM domain